MAEQQAEPHIFIAIPVCLDMTLTHTGAYTFQGNAAAVLGLGDPKANEPATTAPTAPGPARPLNRAARRAAAAVRQLDETRSATPGGGVRVPAIEGQPL